MTNNSYPNTKQLIISTFSKSISFNIFKECRKNFIVNAFICFSSIKGKINFLQMGRFSNKCEQYFRINFEEKFNFQVLNLGMIKERVTTDRGFKLSSPTGMPSSIVAWRIVRREVKTNSIFTSMQP